MINTVREALMQRLFHNAKTIVWEDVTDIQLAEEEMQRELLQILEEERDRMEAALSPAEQEIYNRISKQGYTETSLELDR